MPATAEAGRQAVRLSHLTDLLEADDGWGALLRALAAGDSGTVDGAWASSAALAAAGLAREAPRTVLVALAHPGDLDAWSADLASFAGYPVDMFPGWDAWPPKADPFDPTAAARTKLLRELADDPPALILSTIQALQQPVPAPQELTASGRRLRVGGTADPDGLARWLVANGYKRVEAVEFPAEFSVRGGIIDVYAADGDDPVRVELFGDEVESLRRFSPRTQRSQQALDDVLLLGEAAAPDKLTASLANHLPPDAWVVLVEPTEVAEQGKLFHRRVSDPTGLFVTDDAVAGLLRFPSVTVTALPRASVEQTFRLRVESVERFSGKLEKAAEELRSAAGSDRVVVACRTDAEVRRLREVLPDDNVTLAPGSVSRGFRALGAEPATVVLGSQHLFSRGAEPAAAGGKRAGPRRRLESRAIDSFLDLQDGDYVVHVAHGIAVFRGMELLDPTDPGKVQEEHLKLEFKDGVIVHVPASKIDLVQRYVGGGQAHPPLSKFGGASWQKRKDKVRDAVRDMASEMIQLQAVRDARPGFAYPHDTEWQREFEDSFPYQETPDQLAGLDEIRGDMQRPRPMDRLICGDVGYGKTELALRAAFKAVDNGKQVAVLVPTTVLAEQHYRTFTARFAPYPFNVGSLNRYRSAGELRETVAGLKRGAVDIVIGTHRLVSADVEFKELGLAIIDEEQRFGVRHKERLKQLRATVDVLTLSATPIPRTLHQALLGVRDISNLETPPPERQPVETRVVPFDKDIIRPAILRELNRGGQVYVVHNRVYDIHEFADKIRAMVPEAKVAVGHGQMTPEQLERAMLRFVKKEADILVATTIIESGLDIPNANTIFIDEADHYGLADLHQLRGRVGRQRVRAYAYLMLGANRAVNEQAARRLKAIEEFTQLGAGFQIAMRDLEIRGAGNLLGSEQSGHIAAVGYEMYCQLLENEARALRNQPPKAPVEVNVELGWPAALPRDYVPGQKQRIEVYRRLARVRDPRKIADFREEMRDRFGPPPGPAEWLLRVAEVRLLAARWHVASVHHDGHDYVMTYRSGGKMRELEKLSSGRVKIVDEKSAYVRTAGATVTDDGLYELLRSVLSPAKQAV